MKFNTMQGLLMILLLAVIAAVAPQPAQAAGTAAATSIVNGATVSYEVGGVPQSAVTGTATFLVDRKINLSVTKNADKSVIPGSPNQSLVYLVSNLSNTAIRFQLVPTSKATNTWSMNNVRIYLDNGGTPNAYDGTDTLYVNAGTFGNIASDATITVLIVADTPAGVANALAANYDLEASAVDFGTTTVTTATAGGDTAGVDTVFADAAGSATGDTANDGTASAFGTYTVTAAGVTVSKAGVVYSDPVNGTTNPKAIPGAVITYTITISNAAGGQNATNVTVSDSLLAEFTAGHVAFKTQFIDGTNSCGATQGIVVDTVCKSNAADGDGADFTANVVNVTAAAALTVNAGQSKSIKFQVTIQ